MDAVQPASDEANDVLNYKIAEYTWAVVKDKPCFHISLVMDVSPYCDCHGENDVPIVPDVGMFASFDPIALDQACADAVNAQPSMPGSVLDERDSATTTTSPTPTRTPTGELPGARREAGPGHPGVRAGAGKISLFFPHPVDKAGKVEDMGVRI